MHFLLVVLKGIGMILAILLLVVLLLLFAVLFSPIRYQIEGENEEQVSVSFQGNFLLFVLRFAGAYQKKQVTFQVKVFGYPVFRYPKPEVTQKRKKRSKKKKTCATDDSSQKAGVEEKDFSAYREEQPQTGSGQQHTKEQEKKGIFFQIKAFFEKLKEWILHFPEKLKQAKEKAKNVKQMLLDESNKEMAVHLLKEFRYMMKHLKPKKLKADFTFSTGDPATTGQVLGILCMFPVMYRYDMHVSPDFVEEKFYVKGTFWVKGQIRLIHMVVVLIRLLKDKNVRKLIKNRL